MINLNFSLFLDIVKTEGIFRRCGSVLRIRQLHTDLRKRFLSPYLFVPEPNPQGNQPDSKVSDEALAHAQRRQDIYEILAKTKPFDVTGALLRCLSSAHLDVTTKSTSLIPPEATDLFVQITKLQYHLKDAHEDWAHLLCHSRQLLGYRTIIQCLLPAPERRLLLKLLALLQKITSNVEDSKMTAGALARCLAVAVFGLPNNEAMMGCYIDILTNLIELSDGLTVLPTVLYRNIRRCLKVNFGVAPARQTQQDCNASDNVEKSLEKRSWTTCQMNANLLSAQLPVHVRNLQKIFFLPRNLINFYSF